MDCGALNSSIINGTVDTSSGTVFMSTAKYTCHIGYILNGTETRTCSTDGIWVPAEPSCDGKYNFRTMRE